MQIQTRIFSLSSFLIASGLLVASPARAQISAVFTNTRPVTTPLGVTNVLDVERAASDGSSFVAMAIRPLNVRISLEEGYEFQGFTALTLPSNEQGDPITSSDFSQDPRFSSAVGTTNPNGQEPFYEGGVLNLQVRSTLPTGLYYRYALDGTTGFARSLIRFQARPVGDTNPNNVRTATLFYGVNVLEAGSLSVNAPEPGTLALGLSALPVLGAVVRKRRRK